MHPGAGVIFGATGGVMEAALRTSYFLITGKNPDADAFHAVRRTREDEFTMTAEIPIGDLVVKTAIVSGLGNARRLIERMSAEKHIMILWKSGLSGRMCRRREVSDPRQ